MGTVPYDDIVNPVGAGPRARPLIADRIKYDIAGAISSETKGGHRRLFFVGDAMIGIIYGRSDVNYEGVE